MSTGKHTPGPWKVGSLSFGKAIVIGNRYELAHVPEMDGNRDANARLIAAAPELLEACKELVLQYGLAREKLGIDCESEAIKRAEIAIAKAEGEQ